MSEKRPSKKRLHIAFAVAVLIGGAILLFATEFAAAGDKEAAEQASVEAR